MSTAVVIKCEGSWDEGRMPCRGKLPIPAARVRVPRNHDLLDEHAAHILAWNEGWAIPHPDRGGPTLCPAHKRIREQQLQLDLARRAAEQITVTPAALEEIWPEPGPTPDCVGCLTGQADLHRRGCPLDGSDSSRVGGASRASTPPSTATPGES